MTRGEALHQSDLMAAVRAAGVAIDVSPDTLAELAEALNDPNFTCERAPLAAGQAAQDGRDGWLELMFAPGLQPGHVRDDGTVDYHDRDLLKPVEQGEVIATLHPPVPGIPGRRVDGGPIPSVPPHKPLIQLLSGVELAADQTIRARRSGTVLYQTDQLLDVVDCHTHHGSVDLRSGDLHMQGSLIVEGSVQRGFAVIATGDIEIHGDVDSATVQAGGRLSIRGRVRGGDGGDVFASGDLTAHHVESAIVRSLGQLTVKESVHSHLTARQIQVTGRLRGGSATAETRVSVHEVGTPNGIDTRLVVGEPLSPSESATTRAPTPALTTRQAPSPHPHTTRSDHHQDPRHREAPSPRILSELQGLVERERLRRHLVGVAILEVGLAHPNVCLRIGGAQIVLTERVRGARYHLDPQTGTLVGERLGPAVPPREP